ncbi:uncharacterized protein, partial [Pseudochaenichthys georgianus]|uniref:uncharacterized protein n=1 Tax=Pseudochaenichthys georgianus TaxID=52239 RepID=UPI00146E63B6
PRFSSQPFHPASFDRHSSVNQCSYQLGPVEARNRPTQHDRNEIKVVQAELELRQAEKVERAKQQRAKQWLQTQAARSDRRSESVHFLPEISSDILNGGRVQLVADLGSAERHASGSCANNSLAAQPCNENDYPRRNSSGHARREVPSPPRVTSAPSKKERMSFRDNPVMKSGGWGGGKKRDKFYKSVLCHSIWMCAAGLVLVPVRGDLYNMNPDDSSD